MEHMVKLREMIEGVDEGYISVLSYEYEKLDHGHNENESEKITIWFEKKEHKCMVGIEEAERLLKEVKKEDNFIYWGSTSEEDKDGDIIYQITIVIPERERGILDRIKT